MKPSNIFLPGIILGVSARLAVGQVAAPVLSPAEGDSFAQFPLTITCATPGAQIRYTLNGEEPTIYDPAISSGGTVIVNRNWTLKAKAWSGVESSSTTTGAFALTGDIAGGGAHSLGLRTPGALWAWGLQTGGRLGNNASAAANISTPVASRYSSGTIGDARMIATGTDHSTFLRNGGTVWSFGTNATGQLGDNSTTSRITAVQVKKSTGATDWLTGSVAVAAGQGFSLSLASNGEVFAWGNKTSGRLGDGTTTGTRLFAGKVYQGTSGTTPLTGIGRIAASGGTGLGLNFGTGNVWAWGNNVSGQLGQGNVTNLSRALRMKLNSSTFATDVADIACAPDHSVIVRWKTGDPALQGRVFCAGQQQYGRLGNNLSAAATVTYPVQVLKSGGTPLDNVVSVAAGSAHTLALDGNGNVWAWGYNLYGAIGDNTTTNRAVAVKVRNPAGTADLSNIVRIAAGGSGLLGHSLAVAADGTVYAWGCNANGQLGNGTTSTAATKLPVLVGGGLDLVPTTPEATVACAVSPSGYSNSLVVTAFPLAGSSQVTSFDFMVDGVLKAQIPASGASPVSATVTGLSNGIHQVYAMATDGGGLKCQSPSVYLTLSDDPASANLDTDGDGLIDSTEAALGTSVTDPDTDGDGIPDGIDPLPLVPSTVTPAAATTLTVWSPLE